MQTAVCGVSTFGDLFSLSSLLGRTFSVTSALVPVSSDHAKGEPVQRRTFFPECGEGFTATLRVLAAVCGAGFVAQFCVVSCCGTNALTDTRNILASVWFGRVCVCVCVGYLLRLWWTRGALLPVSRSWMRHVFLLAPSHLLWAAAQGAVLLASFSYGGHFPSLCVPLCAFVGREREERYNNSSVSSTTTPPLYDPAYDVYLTLACALCVSGEGTWYHHVAAPPCVPARVMCSLGEK